MHHRDRPITAAQRAGDQIDTVVSAELPSVPVRHKYSATAKGEAEFERAKEECERLTARLVTSMLHRDCANDRKAPCRQEDQTKCAQCYPKEFQEHTVWNEQQIYPRYRRRKEADGGRVLHHKSSGGHIRIVDNRWVVPHNPFLVLKYDCHINTEVRNTALAKHVAIGQSVPS